MAHGGRQKRSHQLATGNLKVDESDGADWWWYKYGLMVGGKQSKSGYPSALWSVQRTHPPTYKVHASHGVRVAAVLQMPRVPPFPLLRRWSPRMSIDSCTSAT